MKPRDVLKYGLMPYSVFKAQGGRNIFHYEMYVIEAKRLARSV